MLHILGFLLQCLVAEYCIPWQTFGFSLSGMKAVMGRTNLVWPSAWLKGHHRFYFKSLQCKPSEGHKLRGVRFALSCWASSKGKDLPCFSKIQGRALRQSAWDLPYLELPKTFTEVISPFSTQPPCLQLGLVDCAPRSFADGWELCALVF